ncbi:MAG: peroxiredoxin [Flavobacteriales bacterium]|nr:peroxiredoxin [Flavobacteriales bacterium]
MNCGSKRELFRFSALRGNGPVVLYFYPKDNTPVCTKEACTFRDDHSAFSVLGATVIGISEDDPSSHRAFAERHKLPFTLLTISAGTNGIGNPSLLGQHLVLFARFHIPHFAGTGKTDKHHVLPAVVEEAFVHGSSVLVVGKVHQPFAGFEVA